MIRLRLPALRERREDVPALTRFFLQKSAKELGVEAKRITEAALDRLMRLRFPGNVRQLENICHWLTVMAPAQVVEVEGPAARVAGRVAVDPDDGGAGGRRCGRHGQPGLAEPVVSAGGVPAGAVHEPRPGLRCLVPAAATGGSAPAWVKLRLRRRLPCRARMGAAATPGRSAARRRQPSRAGWPTWSARRSLSAGAGAWTCGMCSRASSRAQMIRTALEVTRGRRIEAAHKLGIGRNTITRKIQELGLED